MQARIEKRGRWWEAWFRSWKTELLQREGATPRGVQIIHELNSVYRRTGLLDQVAGLIVAELAQLERVRPTTFRVLEIGCRDAILLRRVGQQARQRGIPVALHGVEFHESLVQLARQRAQATSAALQFHHAASPQLDELPDQEFDVVCSLFSLHHFELGGLEAVLRAGSRLARGVSLHVDLQPSLLGAAVVWSSYTLLGCHRARADSVLSVRRAYRIDEIRSVARSLGLSATVQTLRQPRLCWKLRIPG